MIVELITNNGTADSILVELSTRRDATRREVHVVDIIFKLFQLISYSGATYFFKHYEKMPKYSQYLNFFSKTLKCF